MGDDKEIGDFCDDLKYELANDKKSDLEKGSDKKDIIETENT